MNMPTNAQWAAVGRHAVSYAMGAVTVASVIGLVSSTDVQTISTSIGQISKGVAEIAAGLGPIITIVVARWAAYTASHDQQVAAVKTAVASGEIKGVAISGTPTKG